MKDIAVYGAGGYGREVACLINKINEVSQTWNFIGFIDDGKDVGEDFVYGKVLGGLDDLNNWEKEINIVMAIADVSTLQNLVMSIRNPNVKFPNLIDPSTSFLDKSSFNIGYGNIIGFGCRFSCNVSIGNFNIILNATTCGHDVIIGNYNILFPEIRLSGYATVKDANFFGMRSAVLQGVKIGFNTRIGAGSIVMRNTKDGFLYMGIPAKRMNF